MASNGGPGHEILQQGLLKGGQPETKNSDRFYV